MEEFKNGRGPFCMGSVLQYYSVAVLQCYSVTVMQYYGFYNTIGLQIFLHLYEYTGGRGAPA